MRIGVVTREYPPEVYGGAGVHVEYLVPQLRALPDIEVDVHCFGAPRDGAIAYAAPPADLIDANAALGVLGTDVSIAAGLARADVVHSHTWYANLAGHLAALLYGIPHVVTAHSLEPRRPWKAEQLGGGYQLSCWAERTAYEAADAVIAVSAGMRADLLDCYRALDPGRVHVVHNGVDTAAYAPAEGTDVLRAYGVDPDAPYVVFVGRITRQKGVGHLIAAAASFDPGIALVLCAGTPDTPAIADRTSRAIAELRGRRPGVVWIRSMIGRAEVIQLLSHATALCCPSVYEPLGIVNLEAMACGAAVIASDVGGIPEVVDNGVTGLLVHYDDAAPQSFESGLADAVNVLAARPDVAVAMGAAGRERAVREFSWAAAAERTATIYRQLVRSGASRRRP
ncbi:MAG: glycogen synthase [Mycobacteriales bacterium]